MKRSFKRTTFYENIMKAAIYLRTSRLEQKPENQLESCKRFAEGHSYEIEGVYLEQLSAWQDKERPQYEAIKEKARRGEIQAVIVWALDRWIRNRDTLLDDVTFLKTSGCKLHSVQESWLEMINLEGPLGRTLQEFLLGLMGSLAEIESSHKSERIKLAIRTSPEGITKSYKGNRWGRKPLPKTAVAEVLRLRAEGKSMRAIAEAVTYTDKNNHPKKLGIGSVHKIIAENSISQPSSEPNLQQLPDS